MFVLTPGLHRRLHPDWCWAAICSVHAYVQYRQGERTLLLEPHHHLRPLQRQDALSGGDAPRLSHQRFVPPTRGETGVFHPCHYC